MLDVIYILGIIAVFVLIGLIGKGVEKLGPRARGSAHHEAMSRGERG